MCGIVGLLSTEMSTWNMDAMKYFKEALFADTLRGFDSTGIFLVDESLETPEVFKKALPAPDFLQLKPTDDLIGAGNRWNIMVGHNRAATRGMIKHHTAHPFQRDHITLVHNGTIFSHSLLPGGSKFTVDSEAICHAISTVGAEETIKLLDGAFTLVWFNEIDKTLNVVRNDERPFSFAKVKARDQILMASEAPMMQWLAMRNKISLDEIVLPKPGQMFSWIVDKDNKKWWNPVSVKSIKLKEKKIYTGNFTGTNYGLGHNDFGGTTEKKSTTGSGNTSISCIEKRKKTLPSNKILALLDRAGTPFMDSITLLDPEFKLYSGSDHGRIILETPNEYPEVLAFEINGISKELWDQKKEDEVVCAMVESAVERQGLITVFLDKESVYYFSKDFLDYEDDEGEDDDNDEYSADSMVKGPNNIMITVKEFDELTKEGCVECTGNVFPIDADKTGWTELKKPICKHCISIHGYENYLP